MLQKIVVHGFEVMDDAVYPVSLYQVPRKLYVAIAQKRVANEKGKVVGIGKTFRIGDRDLMPCAFVNRKPVNSKKKEFINTISFYLVEDMGDEFDPVVRDLTAEEQKQVIDASVPKISKGKLSFADRQLVGKADKRVTSVFDDSNYRAFAAKKGEKANENKVKVLGEWMNRNGNIPFTGRVEGEYYWLDLVCTISVVDRDRYNGFFFSEWCYVDDALAEKKRNEKAAKKAAKKAKEELVAKKLAAGKEEENKEEEEARKLGVSANGNEGFESEAI